MHRPIPGLVSVVIPAFNAAAFVGDAIRSVVAQNHAPLEIIVVDNASRDDTAAVASSAGAVRVITCARPGPSAARNTGLDAAEGEFVQFLDADDELAPGKIARQVEAARRTGADFVFGAYERVWRAADGSPRRRQAVVPRFDTADVLASLIGAHGFVPLAAALIRRSPRLDGVRFDESCRVVEDVRYAIALAEAGAVFACTDSEIGLIVREHDSPARASAVGDGPFFRSVIENARRVHEAWRARGDAVGPDRVRVLTEVWLSAAEMLTFAGEPGADEAIRLSRAVDPDYLARVRLPHRLVARTLGFLPAMRLIGLARRARIALRRRTATLRNRVSAA